MKPDAIKRTIADGINQKLIAYAGKSANGRYQPFVFEPDTGVDESDIEISDEMVLLRAADAREIMEPPRLTRIDVKPTVANLRPGDSTTFSSSCSDQHGRPFEGATVTWAASGGTIDQEGRFSAEDVGDYRIEARANSLVGTAEARVGDITPPPPPPPPPPKGFAWQGTVPPQKWMNFYTKVLSSLVFDPG